MWDINEKAMQDTQKAIDEFGGKAYYKTVDISDAQAVDDAVEDAVKHFGRLDGSANIAVSLAFEMMENSD
jgi:NAD(P)-dependent dehydrogenase (short-subunit alcohol dehydrogenase family)